MKKPYIKPRLAYESFQLSQSIAACYYKVNLTTDGNCITVGQTSNSAGVTVEPGGFVSEPTCEHEIQDYCYTNGTGNYTTFTS